MEMAARTPSSAKPLCIWKSMARALLSHPHTTYQFASVHTQARRHGARQGHARARRARVCRRRGLILASAAEAVKAQVRRWPRRGRIGIGVVDGGGGGPFGHPRPTAGRRGGGGRCGGGGGGQRLFATAPAGDTGAGAGGAHGREQTSAGKRRTRRALAGTRGVRESGDDGNVDKNEYEGGARVVGDPRRLLNKYLRI